MGEKIKSLGYSILYFFIFSGLWFLFFLYSTTSISKIILNSILSSISLFLIVLLSSFFIVRARRNKNKFPFIQIASSIILVIALSAIILGSQCRGGSAESAGFCFIFIVLHSVSTLIASIIFAGLINYFYGRSKNILLILLILGLILVFSVIILIFILNKGCLPLAYICFAEEAVKYRNPAFCEKTSASVYDCKNYYNNKIVEEGGADISICEEQEGELRDECFIHFVRTTKDPEYCKSVNDDCKRINCCMWAYEDREFISKEEAAKCGVENDQIGCGNKKFISE